MTVEGQPLRHASGSTPSGSTAAPTPFCYRDALADEKQRAHKRLRDDGDAGFIVLGNRTPQQLRPNLLGPTLKKRFLGGR